MVETLGSEIFVYLTCGDQSIVARMEAPDCPPSVGQILEVTLISFANNNEPRIHMAPVCAAKGCPRLHTGAYLAETLDSQLNDQSRDYLLSPAGLGIDHGRKGVFFSSIFKWYGEGYIAKYSPNAGLDKTERAVANFCSAYLDSEDRSFLSAGGHSVKYLDYDWSLNGK